MEQASGTAAQAPIAVSPTASAQWVLGAPLITVFALALLVPLVGNDYWVLIATRAAIYWVLVAGLNLMIGFAGQLAIGYVALLTLGAYTTSVLAAGNVVPAINPFLALAAAGCAGALFGVIVGLPALRLRTFSRGRA
jgi:branched-chain amino acid transport system permease protein